MGCKRRRLASPEMPRESLQSTVVEKSRGSVVEVVAAEGEERSNGGGKEEEEEESGWTTYLDQQPLSLSPPRQPRKKRSLARQDSTLSVLSDASSGPLSDHHRSQEQAGDNILLIEKSLLYEDNESDIDNGAFEDIERQLRVLRRLIPEGNKFHDEEMLDKAIEYVHFLQRKIQIFESRRRGDLQERGLCLIPVSMLKLA